MTGPAADNVLIDEAIDVVRDARARAPREFLFTLAAILGTITVVLLLASAIVGGFARDLFLNLGAEVIGALLTVVLIDGLWRRLQTGTGAALDAMGRRLEERRGQPMSNDERQAWQAFVDEYRALTRAGSPLSQFRAIGTSGRRMRELEARGNRTLAEFDRAGSDAAWPSS